MSLELELARFATRPPVTASLSSARSTYSIEDLHSIAQQSPSGSLTPRAPLSAKIDTVNDILKYDLGLEKQYGSLYSAPAIQHVQARSQTMPLPLPATKGQTKSANMLILAAEGEETLLLDHHDHEHNDERDGIKRKTPITAPMPVLLDSPIEDMDIDIDIELRSAKHPRPGWANTPPPRQTPHSASASASSIFNSPSPLGTSSPLSGDLAHSLSKQHVDLRQSRSRSSSSSSGDSAVTITASPDQMDWRKKPSMTVASRLNAFAAPWPLPKTTPSLRSCSGSGSGSGGTSPAQPKAIPSTPTPPAPVPPPIARAESNTLPTPPSLPPKPAGSLPPIFVKREAALLPQGMAQPQVAPMGREWEGENGLSGNDRRRRASEQMSMSVAGAGEGISRSMSNISIASRASTAGPSSASSGSRPDRLVRLGEKLKQTANRPIM